MVKSLKEFCSKADSSCELMPSGAQTANPEDKRRAIGFENEGEVDLVHPAPKKVIGFGREGETTEKSKEALLLEQLGKRRAIGFERDGELVDIDHNESKRMIGFGRDGETRNEEPASSKTGIGFGRENEPPAELGKPSKNPIGFRISQLKNQGR